MQGTNDSDVQAVVRICFLLKCFGYEGEVLRLDELIQRSGLSKTTVFRLMRSLATGDLVERVGRGKYRSLTQTR